MLATTATATTATATTAATATGTFFFDRNAHTDTLECFFFLLISFHPYPPPFAGMRQYERGVRKRTLRVRDGVLRMYQLCCQVDLGSDQDWV